MGSVGGSTIGWYTDCSVLVCLRSMEVPLGSIEPELEGSGSMGRENNWIAEASAIQMSQPKRPNVIGEEERCLMNATAKRTTANYFGLRVEVIHKMECCSLIRYQGRQFIVETIDLAISRSVKCAA